MVRPGLNMGVTSRLVAFADSADFALTAIYFSLLAKEKYTKERPPRIFFNPALRIHKGVEVTRYAQTDFNLSPLFICATRRR